ncbi:MAG: SCP2 sterol-binding domain-containing protein [Candidatus Thorarchaeota archaeon]
MGIAKDYLNEIIKQINTNLKAQLVFVTNISGKDVDWDMIFQFNLDNEDPFFIEIKNRQVKLYEGTNNNAEIVMSGDVEAIVRICVGKGDFTHAISREQITVEKGKVMDVIRFTRAITIVLKTS